MEAQKCKQRRINDIGFFDPTSINEATVGFRSTVDAMCDALIDMQDKKWILLPYNHQAFAKYHKKSKVYRPFWTDFIVCDAKYVLRQPRAIITVGSM
ncbi:hypothetical protein PAHAL_7G095000 [Panicum hallii]|uniref:Uncharacterized protein n=1 Tax=Panicum hallii TaxID=206008 RepID=A0A2T8IBL1_9POAL|nr:hypothetical protein PAHAL_7G095000 [Panicum hallii]